MAEEKVPLKQLEDRDAIDKVVEALAIPHPDATDPAFIRNAHVTRTFGVSLPSTMSFMEYRKQLEKADKAAVQDVINSNESIVNALVIQLKIQKDQIARIGETNCPEIVDAFTAGLETLAEVTGGEHPFLEEMDKD